MLIRGKTVFVYDVEVFPNLFTCTVKNTESKAIRSYEISDRKNDLPLIVQLFLNKKLIMCGYNNEHYDNLLINYLLLNFNDLIKLPVWEIYKNIKQLSDRIITTEKNKFNGLEKYKYTHLFESIDLLAMLFSNKLRIGLKEMQVTMEFPNVLQYDGDFNSSVKQSDIDNVVAYVIMRPRNRKIGWIAGKLSRNICQSASKLKVHF